MNPRTDGVTDDIYSNGDESEILTHSEKNTQNAKNSSRKKSNSKNNVNKSDDFDSTGRPNKGS